MSATTSVLRVPLEVRSEANTTPFTASLAESVAKFFRSRWIYISTVSKLEGYSERNLRDMGVERGIEEFARRAAGL